MNDTDLSWADAFKRCADGVEIRNKAASGEHQADLDIVVEGLRHAR